MARKRGGALREFSDRGIISLLESRRNVAELLRLVDEDVARPLDFEKAERVNRSFVSEELEKLESDVVYKVPFRTGKRAVWVYVLVEHQSKPDPMMGLRLLSYMVELWQNQQREWEDDRAPRSARRLLPIIPVVFYTGAQKWTKPPSVAALMDLPIGLTEFVPSFRTLMLKLQERPADGLGRSGLAAALRGLQAVRASTEDLAAALSGAVGLLETLPEEDRREWERALHFLYMLILKKRPDAERKTLLAAVEDALDPSSREEAEEVKMTGAQVLMAKARIEKGHALLILQLEAKFGSLSASQKRAVESLGDKAIDNLCVRILTANSLEQLGLG